jgi:hypothetical protein
MNVDHISVGLNGSLIAWFERNFFAGNRMTACERAIGPAGHRTAEASMWNEACQDIRHAPPGENATKENNYCRRRAMLTRATASQRQTDAGVAWPLAPIVVVLFQFARNRRVFESGRACIEAVVEFRR